MTNPAETPISGEAARSALQEATAALVVARMCMQEAGHWRNPAGYRTDAALWIDRAFAAMEPAPPSTEPRDEPISTVEGVDLDHSSRAVLATAHQGSVTEASVLDGRRFSEHAGERYRHVKRGTVYTLPFGRAEAMLQTAEPITDDAVLTIYIGEDGMIYARPTHEFHDGRFEPLPAPAAGQDLDGPVGDGSRTKNPLQPKDPNHG